IRLTSMTRPNSSGVVSSKAAKSPTAARCTQMSSLPYSSTARSATAFTCSNCEVSAGTARASPPSRLISSTKEPSPSSPRAETTTFAPFRANLRAVSLPMPLEAPIRTTTCSPTGLSRMLGSPFATLFASCVVRCASRSQTHASTYKRFGSGHERDGPLDVGQVTAVGDDLEASLAQAGGRVLPLAFGQDAVARPPDDEHRHLEGGQTVRQKFALSPEADLGPDSGQLRLQEAGGSAQPVLRSEPHERGAPGAREE